MFCGFISFMTLCGDSFLCQDDGMWGFLLFFLLKIGVMSCYNVNFTMLAFGSISCVLIYLSERFKLSFFIDLFL